MPIYEYECVKCNKNHEVMQKFSDAPLTTCPECSGEMKKLISNTSFVLKGTGWYVTDYASSERKKAMDSEKDTTDKQAAESKLAPEVLNQGKETKTETKTEIKTEAAAV